MSDPVAETANPKDLVISYLVGSQKIDAASYAAVEGALKSGYRIVDVLATPHCVGGGGTSIGPTVITVVLTKSSRECPYMAVRTTRRASQ